MQSGNSISVFLFFCFVNLFVLSDFTAAKSIPAFTSNVIDETKTLTNSEIDELNRMIETLQIEKDIFASVYIFQSLEKESIESVAQRVFDKWKLGIVGQDNGLLLIISIKDRIARLQTGRGLEGDLPDVLCKRILDTYLIPSMREKKLKKAILNTFEGIRNQKVMPLKLVKKKSQASAWSIWWFFLSVVVFLILLIFLYVKQIKIAFNRNVSLLLVFNISPFILVFLYIFVLFGLQKIFDDIADSLIHFQFFWTVNDYRLAAVVVFFVSVNVLIYIRKKKVSLLIESLSSEQSEFFNSKVSELKIIDYPIYYLNYSGVRALVWSCVWALCLFYLFGHVHVSFVIAFLCINIYLFCKKMNIFDQRYKTFDNFRHWLSQQETSHRKYLTEQVAKGNKSQNSDGSYSDVSRFSIGSGSSGGASSSTSSSGGGNSSGGGASSSW